MVVYRYVIKEIVVTFLAVTTILFLIYLSNRLVHFLGDAATGSLPADVVMVLVGLKALASLPVLLPLALYLAVIVALGRLYKDHEMTALTACGIGQGRILLSAATVGLFLAGFVSLISLYGAPWAYQKSYDIQRSAEASTDFTGLASGRFKEAGDGDLIFYAERISDDRRVMENVFAQREQGKAFSLLSSAHAYQQIDEETGDRFLIFTDGYRYEGTPSGGDFRIIEYEEHGVRVEQRDGGSSETRMSARPIDELWGQTGPEAVAELQWRFAMPFSALLLTLVGVMLSRSDPRQGRYAKLFTAILVYVAYNNVMGVAKNWLERGTVPTEIGLWWVHALLLVLFVTLWIRQTGLRWMIRRIGS